MARRRRPSLGGKAAKGSGSYSPMLPKSTGKKARSSTTCYSSKAALEKAMANRISRITKTGRGGGHSAFMVYTRG